MKRNETGAIEIILILLVALLLAAGGFFVWRSNNEEQEVSANISSYEECVAAGYPIMESYPQQCAVPGGETFTRQIDQNQEEQSQEVSGAGEVSLTDYEKKNCEVTHATSATSPFTQDGFSITPVSAESVLLSCHQNDEKIFSLKDAGIDAYIRYTEKEFFDDFSGAPADETWKADLVPAEQGYGLNIVSRDDARLRSCDENPEVQHCGEDLSLSVLITHPRFRSVVFTIQDWGNQDAPRYGLYEKLVGSVVLPR